MNKIDVDAVIDAAPFRGLPRTVVVCTIAILILDGLDIQIISFVAPVLMQEFGIERSALGPLLTAALFGMVLGAFALGSAGDRWGRRPVLLGSTALFSAGTLCAATSPDLTVLMAWRFLTGIGLGGALPNAMALLAEYAPLRRREVLIALAGVGVPIGGMIGAAIATGVVPNYGWRAMFLIGGALPALACIALAKWLPESPRYLVAHGDADSTLVDILNRIGGTTRYAVGQLFQVAAGALPGRPGLRMLLSRELRRDTLGLWLLFATNLFSIFTFFSWAPVILTSFGLPLDVAVRGSLVFNLAGVAGGIVTAWGVGRYGSRRTITFYALVAGAALLLLSRVVAVAADGHAAIDQLLLMLCIAAAGFALIGIQTSAYRLGTQIYPVTCRASGIGWAAGVGRFGSILSSLVAGLLLAQLGGPGFFVVMAVIAAAAIIGAWSIVRHG